MGLNYMYTSNGRAEHKVPLLALLLPPWVEAEHPGAAAALRANAQRLVSGYDLHATMHQFLHLGEPGALDAQQAAGGDATAGARGVGLLDEVPAGRTCDEAGVQPEFCQCFAP